MTLSFWHPVGPHSGESLADIISRKKRDVETYGVTYWSFSPAKIDRVEEWRREFALHKQSQAMVHCSGARTKDPGAESRAIWMQDVSHDTKRWMRLPNNAMTSYHKSANSNGVAASAFVVSDVSEVNHAVIRPKHWYSSTDRAWKSSMLPTRGEFLIEEPLKGRGPELLLILTVVYPFVVWVR